MQLQGRVAVITGAGRGLGRAIALRFSEQGAGVCLFSRTEAELKGVADEVSRKGGESLVVSGDVSQQKDVSRLIDKTVERFGTVDILVNNASIIGPPRFLQNASPEAWLKTVGINLNGAFLCCRAVLPIMERNHRGKIINVTSGLGSRPYPRFNAYAVSKAGINQLTRSLAEEFMSEGIKVNAIDPGVMNTTMQEEIRRLGEEKLGKEVYRRFNNLKVQGELRDPMEVAQLAVFLASPQSDHITGQIVSLHDLPRLRKGS